jgi:mono/diheme cytochrome c family protein
MYRFTFAFTLACAVGCSGNKSDKSDAPAPAPSSAAQEARDTFNTLCSTCHGQDGTGNGPGAATLDPKPRNYTDKAWQASVTDEQIKQIILGGGPAVGKSPMMPPSPQFENKPAVVDELVKIVRGFGDSK